MHLQDQVMVIYTVSYPPRLVPTSLLLPGDDQKASTLTATSALSPAAALAANATRFSNSTIAKSAAVGRRRLLSPVASLALGDLAYETAAGSGVDHIAALENEGYMRIPHKPG